jgi:hypothetical protein
MPCRHAAAITLMQPYADAFCFSRTHCRDDADYYAMLFDAIDAAMLLIDAMAAATPFSPLFSHAAIFRRCRFHYFMPPRWLPRHAAAATPLLLPLFSFRFSRCLSISLRRRHAAFHYCFHAFFR